MHVHLDNDELAGGPDVTLVAAPTRPLRFGMSRRSV